MKVYIKLAVSSISISYAYKNTEKRIKKNRFNISALVQEKNFELSNSWYLNSDSRKKYIKI